MELQMCELSNMEEITITPRVVATKKKTAATAAAAHGAAAAEEPLPVADTDAHINLEELLGEMLEDPLGAHEDAAGEDDPCMSDDELADDPENVDLGNEGLEPAENNEGNHVVT